MIRDDVLVKGGDYMAKETRRTVLGLFNTRENADSAITQLENIGYSAQNISVIVRDNSTGGTTTVTTDAAGSAEGAVSGATTGAAVGGVAGLLVGLGALAIPGVGALFITGPIAAALGLTGAAATTASGAMTGALAGGLIGALTNMGVEEETARIYEDRVRSGDILLAAPVIDNTTETDVTAAFNNNGASEVHVV